MRKRTVAAGLSAIYIDGRDQSLYSRSRSQFVVLPESWRSAWHPVPVCSAPAHDVKAEMPELRVGR